MISERSTKGVDNDKMIVLRPARALDVGDGRHNWTPNNDIHGSTYEYSDTLRTTSQKNGAAYAW